MGQIKVTSASRGGSVSISCRTRKGLPNPSSRRKGTFVEAEWDEVLDLVAQKLSAIKKAHGADAIAALSSAKCTNEENYLMQKFMRAVVGTNNIDHCARL